jgi:hypothetical protein
MPTHFNVQHTMTVADNDEGTPVSVKIRERIKAQRQRFHANDNIAEFIQPGELEKLLDEVDRQDAGRARQPGDRHRGRPQHQRHRAPRGQDVPQRGVQGPLRQAPGSPSFPTPNTSTS